MEKLEIKVMEELYKYEKDEVNFRGIMRTVKRAEDYSNALKSMYIYLTDEKTSKTRDSLIRFAYKQIGIEFEEA